MPQTTSDSPPTAAAPGLVQGLALRDVTFGYVDAEAVVDGFSAQLAPGRLTVLIGPNAAGKTTLLRLMLGQLSPRRGRVTLDGRDVAHVSPHLRARRMAYVPQRGSVSFSFTVREVVEMGRYAQPPSAEAVETAIRIGGLSSVSERVFAHLSGGQQQRVLLARAMAQLAGGVTASGRSLLADEPVSGMDLRHAHLAMGQLQQLASAGAAVLVVLHDLSLAARYADDVWLTAGGRLIAAGRWSDVLTPAVLEPVYGVRLAEVRAAGTDRPAFVSEPAD